MALDPERLKAKMVANAKANGFIVDDDECMISNLAASFAAAMVEEVTTNAQVTVPSMAGGVYQVE